MTTDNDRTILHNMVKLLQCNCPVPEMQNALHFAVKIAKLGKYITTNQGTFFEIDNNYLRLLNPSGITFIGASLRNESETLFGNLLGAFEHDFPINWRVVQNDFQNLQELSLYLADEFLERLQEKAKIHKWKIEMDVNLMYIALKISSKEQDNDNKLFLRKQISGIPTYIQPITNPRIQLFNLLSFFLGRE